MATYQHISHGFDPVFDERSRVLVLGSFPSVLSRKNEFYYGNPQNRFWRVMASVLSAPVPPNENDATTLAQSIAAKRALLLDGGVALWDVIEECDIKGSSDASIKNVVPARVGRIFERANIDAVVCNGSAAGRLYKRYLQWEVGIEAHVLPSTSPANAAWDLARLTERWQREFAVIEGELATADKTRAGADAGGQATAKEAREGEQVTKSGRAERGGVAYAVVGRAPAATNYAVHKSMQGNKRQDTKPELLVRERLREAGLGGYRLQWKVPGRPDVAWPGKKVCLFINGCFWHRCPRCNPSTPKKNVEYWTAKFTRNVERDRENEAALLEMGWRVHTIWECELKKKTREDTFARLLPQLARELGKPLKEPGEGEGNAAAQAEGDAAAQAGGNNPVRKKRPAPEKGAEGTERAGDGASASSAERHFMYVIECADGTLYTGYTPNVEARFAAHQAGTGAKYTRGRGPLTLVAYAEFSTKHDAMSAEYRFKKLSRPRKDALLAQAAKTSGSFAEILKQELSI